MTEESEDRNERMLVAGSLITPAQAAEAAQHVGPRDIVSLPLRHIWMAVQELIKNGETEIDLPRIAKFATTNPKAQDGLMKYMSELLDGYPKMTSLVNVAQRVHRRATLRGALAKVNEIAESIRNEIQSPDGDVKDLEERLAQLSMAVSSRSDSVHNRTTFKDKMRDVEKMLDALAVGPAAGSTIPTGIRKLDLKLGGGLRHGQLHTILGSTGSGKTALASQIADEAVIRGHRSIMFSMEVDDVDVYVRDVERTSGRSRWDLLPHKSRERREKAQEALVQAMSRLGSTDGKVVYSEPMSVEGIRQAILTENLRYGQVEVVVVDHAQVALPSNDEQQRMPRYLEVKNTAEGLRAIAKKLGVAMVLTAQLNPPPTEKGGKKGKPSMDQVRESKDINNCSEVVMVIEHQREQVGDEIVTTNSYIHLDKVRAGSTGRVPVIYRGELFRFEEPYEEPRGDF